MPLHTFPQMEGLVNSVQSLKVDQLAGTRKIQDVSTSTKARWGTEGRR